jgi:hypothetical protein
VRELSSALIEASTDDIEAIFELVPEPHSRIDWTNLAWGLKLIDMSTPPMTIIHYGRSIGQLQDRLKLRPNDCIAAIRDRLKSLESTLKDNGRNHPGPINGSMPGLNTLIAIAEAQASFAQGEAS